MFRDLTPAGRSTASRTASGGSPRKSIRPGSLALVVGALGLALCAPVANASTPVEFDTIHLKPAGQGLNKEYIEVANDSGRARSLAGWSLTDRHGHSYTFGALKVPADDEARVYTGAGHDTATRRYWGHNSSVWTKSGDKATLRDATGHRVATCTFKATKHVVHCD
jgi:hypothetical protein